jgi:hypothetical protein
MADNPLSKADSSNGEYKFDQNVVRLGLGATIVGLLLFGSLGIVSGVQEGITSKGLLMCLLACLLLIGAAIHIARLSGRTLRISDDGISIRDKNGNEVSSLHWIELGRVTERRRMAQLALWDKSGTRRVLVDQQFENFALIRSRILAEYAKFFVVGPLPIQLRNPSPLLLETFLFGIVAAFCAFGTWTTYRQGQITLSAILLVFAAGSLVSLLKLYPRIAGPSELFGDRLILRSLFKTEKIYKKDVSSVELQDVSNPHGGTKFSFVSVTVCQGKPLRITSKFGSIPELYLTLRVWLEQSSS